MTDRIFPGPVLNPGKAIRGFRGSRMTELLQQEGFSFQFDPSACAQCGGRCCNGESGLVRVSPREAMAMASLLEMSVAAFSTRYLVFRRGSLCVRENKTGDNYACALYGDHSSGCRVYDARPRQCRTFPFWPKWKNRIDALQRECPGVVLDA